MRTHSRRSRVARLWAALAALVVVSATLAVSTSGAVAAGSNTLTVKAGEYTYVLKGSPKAGWTQINFDNAGVDAEFFAGSRIKSNFLCSIGYGSDENLWPRNPRLTFEEAGSIA